MTKRSHCGATRPTSSSGRRCSRSRSGSGWPSCAAPRANAVPISRSPSAAPASWWASSNSACGPSRIANGVGSSWRSRCTAAAGRREALGACRRARRVLVDDLGVEPGPGCASWRPGCCSRTRQLLVAPRRHGPRRSVDRCPYLGLAGYEERDAPLFVGRERLTSVLAGRLSDQSVVVVAGASGVGKSSLVRAGLVPALRAGAVPGSASWRIEVRTPAGGTGLQRQGRRRPDVLVLDQAEELFTSLEPAARDDLIAVLGRLRRRPEDGRLVLVFRSDFYAPAHGGGHAGRRSRKRSALVVGPMRADELRRALLEPAAAAGLRLEPELVETVMEDAAGQTEPLPLLSEAMVRTWQPAPRRPAHARGVPAGWRADRCARGCGRGELRPDERTAAPRGPAPAGPHGRARAGGLGAATDYPLGCRPDRRR